MKNDATNLYLEEMWFVLKGERVKGGTIIQRGLIIYSQSIVICLIHQNDIIMAD